MPLSVMGLAWLFCVCNGYLQARWLTASAPYTALLLEEERD